jgi:hypothetical protein
LYANINNKTKIKKKKKEVQTAWKKMKNLDSVPFKKTKVNISHIVSPLLIV